MELLHGAPQVLSNRLVKEQDTYRLLESLNIDFCRVDHEPAMTMEACEQIDLVLGTTICKNLFLANRQNTQFYLLLTPGDKVFKTKELSKQLGVARLSFGSPEKMEEFLHVTPGSASVMGLMYDVENQVQLIIDKDVLRNEDGYFGFHPCINTSSLKIKTDDFQKQLIPALKHTPIVVDLPWEDLTENG